MVNIEVLIIGGGIIGSSIAYHLARQGRQVLVVERHQVAVEPVASWASAGGVRRQGRNPAEGQADPPLSTRAFANAAQRLGATYWTETECRSLIVSGARVRGARTSRDDVSASHVVLTAGAWSDSLTDAVGFRLPVRMQAL